MKKLILSLAVIFSFSLLVTAQDDCMAFFPTDEGTVLVSSSYDASQNLLGTMTYRVNKTYNYADGTQTSIGFTLTDKNGNTIDNGNMLASCMDGNFFLKMNNMGITSDLMSYLTSDTELVGDFLDYPNVFSDLPYDPTFQMSGGEFTIRSKTDKKASVRVRVYNRKYEKSESITTPAGTFNAAKVTFDFEVTQNQKTRMYKGAEWYAMNAGIVKSETYDSNNNLMNYTQLTEIRRK